jgi:site-specific DNA-cytosine methylase/SAM-dependent methyltransferase
VAAVRPKAIGVYIFAGGFTLGVKRHFDVHCVLEESNYGVKTARQNQPEIPVIVGVKNWPLADLKVHEWDLIYGNPPCAAWSQAGSATKKGRKYDSSPLVACTERYFTLLEELRPKVWAWESVQQAWKVGEDFVRRLAERARALGYSTTIFLHDAQYLNVPQSRRRMFMICHRVEGRIDLPDFTKVTTFDEALRGLNDRGVPLEKNIGQHRWLLGELRPGEELRQAFMRLTPPDQIKTGERGQTVGRPAFTIKRAKADRPAYVVMHEMVHPTEPRGLSIKELAILCGYPATYDFVDANDAGQVGRGVCPPVGEYLARNVARAVAADVAVEAPTFTLVDYTTPEIRRERLRYHEPTEKDTAINPPDYGPHNTLIKTEAKPKKSKRDRKLISDSISAETETATPVSPVLADSSPHDGEGSGRYIRRLLRHGVSGDQVLELVHAHYEGSKASKADIAWNRGRMRKEDAARGTLRVESTSRTKSKPHEGDLFDVPRVPMPAKTEAHVPSEECTADQTSSAEPCDTARDNPTSARQEADEAGRGTAPLPTAGGRRRTPPTSPISDGEPSGELSDRPGALAHVPQPSRFRRGVDPEREFDRTSLRANSHGQWIHRDYGAHFFRWGFAGRFVTNETDVLDVGCGPDVMMIHALTMPRNQVPRSYVGVDLNREPKKHPARQWATLRWEFNFTERGDELNQFDLVTCFEVLEHMRKADGLRLLEVLRRRLRPSATLLLSTPVFNGKAAANHLMEWQIDELKAAVEAAGLAVERRHGTFASQGDIRRAASAAELDVVERLSAYYSGEVLACFLAPLYPDASRNNVWVLSKK